MQSYKTDICTSNFIKMKIVISTIIAFLFILNAYSQIPSYLPTNGLIGYWPFNNSSQDASSHGHNGTLTNGTDGSISYTSDINGISNAAILFSGNPTWNAQGGYVLVTNDSELYLNTEYTVNLFIYTDTTNNVGELVNKGKDNLGCFFSRVVGQYIQFGTSEGYLSYIPPSIHNSWHMVTFSREGSGQGKIFFDGEQKVIGTIGTTLDNSFNIWFGLHQFGNNGSMYPFQGKMDDIGIWNRSLTADEIKSIFQGCITSIITEPSNQNVNSGFDAQFITIASDSTVSYRWQTDNGLGFQNLSNAGQYQGAFNDTLIVNNVTLTNNNQQFRCIVTSGACSDTSDVATLTVQGGTGIQSINNLSLKLNPNPVSNKLLIEVANDSKEIKYMIFNFTGQSILMGSFTKSIEVPLKDLSSGVYFIKISDGKGIIYKKFIKQ